MQDSNNPQNLRSADFFVFRFRFRVSPTRESTSSLCSGSSDLSKLARICIAITSHATMSPATHPSRSIAALHIGHGKDAAIMSASHSTHTARWLHGTYRQLRSLSMQTTQRWPLELWLSSLVLAVAWKVVRSLVSSSCLTWTKAVRWATSCWRKVVEEDGDDSCS